MDIDVTHIGLLDDEEIELDRAGLALSQLDHAGVDLEPYFALLDEVGERLAELGAEAFSPEQQGAALARVFHREFGFTGDADSYDAPLNADLIRVLDRRQGLPVSLSLLYVAAARRVGWTAFALNTPGHVLVRLGEGGGDEDVRSDDEERDERSARSGTAGRGFAVIDPFNEGRLVPRERLAALLYGAVGPERFLDPEHVAPLDNRGVLLRLLRNQATRAEQDGDPVRALIVLERMTRVAPGNPDGWWELARLQLQLGDIDGGRASLSAMLEVTRDPERRRLVSTTLEAIAAG